MSEKSYFVRTCVRNVAGQLVSPSRQARGFVWPEEIGSVVTCPDWDPDGRCGGGLHGLRPGDNSPGTWATGPNAVWMICSYDPKTAVVLEGKVKAPSCTVEYVVDLKDGARTKVPLWLKSQGVTEPIYRAMLEDSTHVIVGDYGYAITGPDGTAIAGFDGTAKAGHSGTAQAGDYGQATVGTCGVATVGNNGTAIAGVSGKARAGYQGTAIAGSGGRATAGAFGHATAGNHGTAIVANHATAIVGHGGKAQAGLDGVIQISYFSELVQKNRIVTGYIGEDGLEPDTLYGLDEEGHFVKVS